jgi:hypothetical protein
MFLNKTKTVDSIVSAFKRTVEELRDHAMTHRNLNDRRLEALADLDKAISESHSEIQRAEVVANRIESILS